jgi:hypothetical protein
MLPIVQIVWPPYKGLSAIALSLILFAISGGAFFAAQRMKEAIKLPKMGKVLGAIVIVIWGFSIIFFLGINKLFAKYTGGASNLGPIFPITITSAVVIFCYAAYVTRRGGPLSSLGNGFLAFIAGPMVFELPFALIIIPLVKAPVVAEILFLIPLFTIVITTLSMLLLSRRIALTKNSVYLFAAMMFVFALWALDGYHYPTDLVTITLNGVSKVLSFACIAALFFPEPPTNIKTPEEKLSQENVNKVSSASGSSL